MKPYRLHWKSILAGALLATAVGVVLDMLNFKQQLRLWLIPPPHESLPDYLQNVDIHRLITIRSTKDVSHRRQVLGRYLWGTNDPSKRSRPPFTVTPGHRDDRFSGVANLARIDRFVVTEEFGINSVIYDFIPERMNGSLILFHEGHNGDFVLHKDVIAEFVKRGYEVGAFAMPLLGQNSQPIVAMDDSGPVRLDVHAKLSRLEPSRGHSIRFFVDPVMRFLDYALTHKQYQHVAMVGFSGGGWATVLMAAMDPRIQWSFPVAGSSPLFLRKPSSIGDWEEWDPGFYRFVNHLDLYILGAEGAGRRQLQILAKHDPCCHGGIGWTLYRDAVRDTAASMGGNFDVFMDGDTREHELSAQDTNIILQKLEEWDRPHQ